MNRSRRKLFSEQLTEPPATVWGLAVSRLQHEQEQGYDGLSLLLLLLESVLDVRAIDGEEQPEPWLLYSDKMNKPQGKTIECFELPLDKKLAKSAPLIAISTLPAMENCIAGGAMP